MEFSPLAQESYWYTGLEAALRPVRMEGETISPSKPPPS